MVKHLSLNDWSRGIPCIQFPKTDVKLKYEYAENTKICSTSHLVLKEKYTEY